MLRGRGHKFLKLPRQIFQRNKIGLSKLEGCAGMMQLTRDWYGWHNFLNKAMQKPKLGLCDNQYYNRDGYQNDLLGTASEASLEAVRVHPADLFIQSRQKCEAL